MEGEGAAATQDAGAEATTNDKAAAGQLEALKAERTKRQELEKALAAYQAKEAEAAAAAKKAEEDAAKQRGEYERLYGEANEKLTAAEQRLADYTAREAARLERLTTRNQERVEALPENLRAIVPGLDPEALADWLDKAAPVLLSDDTRPAGTRGKPPVARGEAPYPPEAYAVARQQGKPDSDPAEQKRWIANVWLKTAPGRAWQDKQAAAAKGGP